jgi:hypothetical protein
MESINLWQVLLWHIIRFRNEFGDFQEDLILIYYILYVINDPLQTKFVEDHYLLLCVVAAVINL